MPWIYKGIVGGAFHQYILELVMTDDEHGLFFKFIMMKPTVLHGLS